MSSIQVNSIRNSRRFTHAQTRFLSSLLKVDVEAVVNNYRNWQDGQATILGRLLLYEGLAALNATAMIHVIQRSQFNRPFIPDHEVDFNISHSGELVLCAMISNGRVGVDIEQIAPVTIDDFKTCFTPYELASINAATDPIVEFYRHWTMKEAVIKGDGRGLSVPLRSFAAGPSTVLSGKTWYITELKVGPDYSGHLATDREYDKVTINERAISDF